MNDLRFQFPHLTDENLQLLNLREEWQRELIDRPHPVYPLFRPCRIRVLLVSEFDLTFNMAPFGLETFVRSLLDFTPFYARFEISLGYIDNTSNLNMLPNEPRIVKRTAGFKFDNPAHFDPVAHDVVFLFGRHSRDAYGFRGASYPNDRLKDSELRVLTDFMEAGGGVFATGDHGSIGKPMCGAVPRLRSMRQWEFEAGPASPDDLTSQVSMRGAWRNDTNRPGHTADNTSPSGSEFEDQSDDIPQEITPKTYSRWGGIFSITFPHPLLCGPKGVIRTFPDHPHEGQCLEPTNLGATYDFGSGQRPEYPPAIGGAQRPIPEIVATGQVLSGTTSGGKQPTNPHSFGLIGAYDGHRAAVGRVVTDSTWHHFVNLNLIGILNGQGTKQFGFTTEAGQPILENIRAYYRNIALWLARPEQISCMANHVLWAMLWEERIVESVLLEPSLRFDRVPLSDFFIIGRHATDAIGRKAGRCEAWRIRQIVFEEILHPEFKRYIDIWSTLDDIKPDSDLLDQIQWVDPRVIMDIALGGALVALRDKYENPDRDLIEKMSPREIQPVIQEGAQRAMQRVIKSMGNSPLGKGNWLLKEDDKGQDK